MDRSYEATFAIKSIVVENRLYASESDHKLTEKLKGEIRTEIRNSNLPGKFGESQCSEDVKYSSEINVSSKQLSCENVL